jgi:hypothetical protein
MVTGMNHLQHEVLATGLVTISMGEREISLQ